MTLFKVYTGPCLVHDVAERLRQKGFTVACEGTENVLVEAGNAPHVLDAVGFKTNVTALRTV